MGIVITVMDHPELWSPFKKDGIITCSAGRIALEEKEWEDSKKETGIGGLACKYIYKKYKEHGIAGLERLNGGYVVLLYDVELQKLFICVDRCGMYPCFRTQNEKRFPFFSSHPDILAKMCNISNNLDNTSIAEFLMTGKVSFPYTYYKSICRVG